MTFGSLEGKKALVTGGNRGIGKVIAQGLKDAGADVIICGSNEISLKEAALELGVQWERRAVHAYQVPIRVIHTGPPTP